MCCDHIVIVRFNPRSASTAVVNVKTPTQLMLPMKFLDCTSEKRYLDKNKLYVDTPAISGHGGGPCFPQSNENSLDFLHIIKFLASSAIYSFFTKREE